MSHTKEYKNKMQALLASGYKMLSWDEFDYSILQNVNITKRSGKNAEEFNDCWIMFDTETSRKKKSADPQDCHVVAFTVSIRAYNQNIVTLYGHDPVSCIECISNIIDNLPAHNTILYCHNLSYDWVFLRQFFFEKFGLPNRQLNTKPYYPIYIGWENGMQIRDSLILAQRGLEKWANDMQAEHRKAVGSWDYNRIRKQSSRFTRHEKKYIEYDTLAGVECLNITAEHIGARVPSMPYTSTGICRNETRKRGKKHHARKTFEKCLNTWQVQQILEMVFHGGYTHANRYLSCWIVDGAQCYDFASSYPYSMLSSKVPMSSFKPVSEKMTADEIIKQSEDYAYVFLVTIFDFEQKDYKNPMPMLQKSKLLVEKGCTNDNGRILEGKVAQIWMNEYDLKLYREQYKEKRIEITDVYYATKDYLPRWFTDYIYELFTEKCMLKGVDPVRYMIKKGELNGEYGQCVQHPVRIEIMEHYLTGEYKPNEDPEKQNKEKLYEKYCKNKNNILPYQWGVWVTSESMYRLFQLSKCIANDGIWLYSDTDSIYATKWDEVKLKTFNDSIKKKLLDRNYPPVIRDDKEYWLGVAERDSHYEKFCAIGAKRYAGIGDDGEIHITVAGVPKKAGSKCLKSLEDFKPGFVFSGTDTGKKQHTYFYRNKIWEDAAGNICGDSIDLTTCDYTLDSPYEEKFEIEDEIYLQVYEAELRGRDLERSHY